jgi:hypothetical protein
MNGRAFDMLEYGVGDFLKSTVQLYREEFPSTAKLPEESSLPTTRAMTSQRINSMPSKKKRAIHKSDKVHEERVDHSEEQPAIKTGGIKWNRTPKEPFPQLSEISAWVGKQLWHKNMPKKYQHMHPKGKLITMDSSYPEGLLAVPNAEGQPRIIVPPTEIKALILQTHEDIHHQNHLKVLHVLKASYYWPNMAKDIQEWCTSCAVCTTASVRRKHLKTKFDPF